MQPAVVDPYAQHQPQQQQGYGVPVAAVAAYPANGYAHGATTGAYAQTAAAGYVQGVSEYDANGQYQQDYR